MSANKRPSLPKSEVSVESFIHEIRGQKVILDSDLARIYGVTTKRLNEQVRRNMGRFPIDFMFSLSKKEYANLKSQNATSSYGEEECLRSHCATSKKGRGGRRYLPLAFTERGAVMAANVLNSSSAVRMSIFVVRAFVRMREMMIGHKELAKQLAALDKKLTRRLDIHETAIVDVLQRIMLLLDPPPPPLEPSRRKIGFHAD